MTGRDLYFISGSPPCWSVMLALEVKRLDFHPHRLDNSKSEQKSPEYLKINPRGQVPVFVEDGTTVSETLAILAYLDAAYPEPQLFGTGPLETARVWQIVCECDGNLRKPVGEISRPLFRGKAQEFAGAIADAGSKVRAELSALDSGLSSTPWLAGAALSAADLVVYPVIMQLMRATGREEAKPLELGLHPLKEHFSNLAVWAERVEALRGYDNAYPPHWK
jgi:glutathione S-transferase